MCCSVSYVCCFFLQKTASETVGHVSINGRWGTSRSEINYSSFILNLPLQLDLYNHSVHWLVVMSLSWFTLKICRNLDFVWQLAVHLHECTLYVLFTILLKLIAIYIKHVHTYGNLEISSKLFMPEYKFIVISIMKIVLL